MALSTAYARARHASALLLVGFLFGLPSVASASEVFPSGARLRFSTTGVPVWTTPPVQAASTAAGGGAAVLRATQSLNIGGVSVPISLSRNVPVSNVARVLAVGSRFLGPLMVAGLVYEGVRYVAGEWVKDAEAPLNVRWTYVDEAYSATPAEACAIAWGTPVTGVSIRPAGGTADCTVDGFYKGPVYRRALCNDVWVAYPTSTAPCAIIPGDDVPATDEDLEISFQQGLVQAPTLAPTLLDLALKDSRARAALLADALQLDGPATVEGPTTTTTEVAPGGDTTINRSTTYNINFAGDVVTVTETNSTTTTHPDQSQTVTTTVTGVAQGAGPQPAPEAEDLECGLPGTPKCAIDETGTPESDATVSSASQALESAWQERDEQVQSSVDVDEFGWSYTLPTLTASCSPIPVGELFTMNICPAVDVSRAAFSFLWTVLAGLYCWRRVTGAVERGV